MADYGDKRVPDRLWRQVRVTDDGCWALSSWASGPEGYLGVCVNGRKQRAHQYFYVTLVGPVPEGLVLDHTCHDPRVCAGGRTCPHRRCVNPAHLEPVTQAENTRRGCKGGSTETHCARGHALTPDKVVRRWPSGTRCVTCRREDQRAYYTRQKAA